MAIGRERVGVVGMWLFAMASIMQPERRAAVLASRRSDFPGIFVFGDSLSDTGNGYISGNVFFTRTGQRPYGETFPGFPFDRFSDGRLLVDFLATYVGLPLLNPSLNSSADFNKGANYAVSGATALNVMYLNSKLIFPLTNDSLDVQVGWHLALKASSGGGSSKPNSTTYSKALYVLEIGGNDYIGALQSLYSPSVINMTIVPLVISKIRNATEVLYDNGARNFMFFSITPLGCSPSILASFPQYPKDQFGCISNINSLSYNHGVQLLAMVQSLRTTYPSANFTFVDYYGAYIQVLRHSVSYGFTNKFDACCGAGPAFPYHYNILLFCNNLSSTSFGTLCCNPNGYLNWDGIHFTDKFNSIIFNLTIGSGSFLNT